MLKDKERIEMWLNRYYIKNYVLIEDEEYGYVVNVNNSVMLCYKELKSIEVKFNIVKGNFFCNNNNLLTLEGCPEIISGDFYCNGNQLVSLRYGPKEVRKDYYCYDNKLITLKGSPEKIHGTFSCYKNNLKNLKYSPKIVNGNFDCSNNKLKDLEYCPETIKDSLICSNNELISLKGIGKDINNVNLSKNKLDIDGLKYLPNMKGQLDIVGNIKLKKYKNKTVEEIINVIKIINEKENIALILEKNKDVSIKEKKVNKI